MNVLKSLHLVLQILLMIWLKCMKCQEKRIVRVSGSYSGKQAGIRILEHFFAFSASKNYCFFYRAMLLSGQSNAFFGEKQCFAPRKALLFQNSLFFGATDKSVLKVGFLNFIACSLYGFPIPFSFIFPSRRHWLPFPPLAQFCRAGKGKSRCP